MIRGSIIKVIGFSSLKRISPFLLALLFVQILRFVSFTAPDATAPRTLSEMQGINTAGTVRT